LEFAPEAYDRLYELKRLTGASTNAEVIRKALQILDLLVMNAKDNYNVQLVKKGETPRELWESWHLSLGVLRPACDLLVIVSVSICLYAREWLRRQLELFAVAGSTFPTE